MKNVLILERSSQNLKKINQKGKIILEGVFAELGVENRNGRIYEEKEYLPHLEYLKKDISSSSLLGELDHPERFEVSLSNVSHKVSELWYDQNTRQIKGRIELLEGTPKGAIAKSLLDAGIPLSISSRAAGTVNEDKTVSIQQIYTYDLVAKPGFEKAQLQTVNESAKARIENQIKLLNESYSKFEEENKNIANDLGILNENISIYDVTDKYPAVSIREEAKKLVKNKNDKMENNFNNEELLQRWTLTFKDNLSKLDQRLNAIEHVILENGINNKEITSLKNYVENLRKLQENHLNWTANIAKGVNKVATHSQSISEKSNEHYKLTKKTAETVDYNAKVLNHTQDWIGNNAKITNAIGETIDHNAVMLNGINEWNIQLAKGVNALHEWGTEKAKAINEIHEWTSSIAKNLNITANWAEDMFGKAISKEDGKRLVEYIETVSESKADPEKKKKVVEMLETHGITGNSIKESALVGIKGAPGLGVITDVKKIGNEKVDVDAGKSKGVEFDPKYQTIVAKMKKVNLGKNGIPKGLKTLEGSNNKQSIGKAGKIKGIMTLDTQKKGSKPSVKISGDGPTTKIKNDQNLKLDTKPIGKLKEDLNKSTNISNRRFKLDEKLGKIIEGLEKEKKLDETLINNYPFLTLLTESERKNFSILNETQKQKVAKEIEKNPTTDTDIIRNLWESAIKESNNTTPLWIKAAPKKYKEIFEKASDIQKEGIKARAEFYDLDTQYKINNFWETSGLGATTLSSLNEHLVTAKTVEETDQKFDSYVAAVGEQLKKLNNR